MKKKGTFIIIERDGKQIAAVLRADGKEMVLDISVTPELLKLHETPCEYFFSKVDKIVTVNGKDIFNIQQQTLPEIVPPKKSIATDWKQKLKESENDEPEIIKEIKKPNLNDSFLLQNTRVPADTRIVDIHDSEVDNFYLKLNQFARFDWGNKFYFFNPSRIEERVNGIKKTRLDSFEITARFGKLFSNKSQLADRQSTAAKELFPGSGNLISPIFKPEWRFVTGLGGHNVYETGITLHHVYGVPYIPASSVKGVVRSWVIITIFNRNEGGEPDLKNAEKRALQNPDFCHVFGCPAESALKDAHQGRVTFFDALPTESPTVAPDIMNPHYPDYYGAKKLAPTDTQSPNPVFFLTVKKTPFQFLLGAKEWDLTTKTFWNGQTLEWWLENALSEHGIGAKTAVGYGYMKRAK